MNIYKSLIYIYNINALNTIPNLLRIKTEIINNQAYVTKLRCMIDIYITNCIKRRLSILKCILQWKQMLKKKVVNPTNLYLNNDFKNPITILHYNQNYKFDSAEIIQLYMSKLEYIDYNMIRSRDPINPYINKPFNMYHHIELYTKLENLNIKIPMTMILFRYYSYNVNILWENQRDYFANIYANKMVNSLSHNNKLTTILFLCDKFKVGKYHPNDISNQYMRFNRVLHMYILYSNKHVNRSNISFKILRSTLLHIIKEHKIPLLRQSKYYKKNQL
jgi:hypothetical protein